MLLLLQIFDNLRSRPYILFANRKDIRLVELTDNKKKVATNIIVKSLEDAAALDYFLEESKVCWSEINKEVIRCASIDPRAKGKVTKVDIVTNGLVKPEGLACDWVGNKIYWTDSDTKRIEVAGLSGREEDRSVLVWDNLDLPRAISLAPGDGLMFWSDWGQYPKIESCGMNGDLSTRRILVDSDIVWPNGLTLDFQHRKLYWLEAKIGYIASIDWDGSNRKTIFVGDKTTLPQPFAISISAEVLYWTDWETNALYSYDMTQNQTSAPDRIKVRGKLSPMDIRVFEPTRQPKSESACASNNGGCSHLCLAAPYPPHYTCHCPTGYKLVNLTTCANTSSALLLVAARESIIKVSLDTSDYTDRVVPLDSVVNSIAIDYDPVAGRVYWTDLEDDHKQSIRSANLQEPYNEQDVITRDVDHPDGVAVDWVGRNLFWTDSGTDRIEVARLDGSSRKVLISEDLDEPRSIVLDLNHGFMFWSDWGKNPRIERAWMDGNHREIIVNTLLEWPNGLALDSENSNIYWCDAKLDKIEMAGIDGSNRRIVNDKNLPHPFGFSLLGDYLYWTDWQDRNIQRADKADGSNRVVMASHLDDLMGLKAVYTSPPVTSSGCNEMRDQCSHLCLTTAQGPVCACPTGHELDQDHMTCAIPDAFLIFTRRDDIKRISIEIEESRDVMIPLRDVQEASALDYDRIDGMIYWSDMEDKTISRAYTNGSSVEIMVEYGLDYPRGLAVDWRTGNLYWSDAGTGRLEMVSLEDSVATRRVLIWKELESPECLVLDLEAERIIWSSWGNQPLLESSNMDGTDREVIVTTSGRATGLTVDPNLQLLLWTDQDSLSISYTSLTSPGHVGVLYQSGHPYSLTQYRSHLYWTDWVSHTMLKAELYSSSSVSISTPTVLKSGLDYVMDIIVYTNLNSENDLSSQSPCYEAKCQYICVPKQGRSSCLCPSHYSLQPDKLSCAPPSNFLLYTQKNKISRLMMTDDDVPDIVLPIRRARSIQSVSYDQVTGMIYWVDQGRGDQPARQVIRRSTDEGDTQMFDRLDKFQPFDLVIDPTSRSLFWSCMETNTINVTRVGSDLVPVGSIMAGNDGRRPRFLALHPTAQQLFFSVARERSADEGGDRIEVIDLRTGLDKTIVNASIGAISAMTVDWALDGDLFWADITLKKIEAVSRDGQLRRVVVSEGIVEIVGLSVQGSWLYWADRDQGVIVRVDKIRGTQRQVVLSKVSRLSSLTSVTQLDQNMFRENPCLKGNLCSHFCSYSPSSGVVCGCPHGQSLVSDNATCGLPPTCQPSEFTCRSRGPTGAGPACIPIQWRCDGQSECADRSDELDCPECGPGQFRCQSGQCVSSNKLCDGSADCKDRTDENLCCPDGQFQCSVTGECVSRDRLCDGQHDCGDSTDELMPKCTSASVLNPASPARRPETEVTSTTSTVLIAVFAVLISTFLVGLIVVYCKRKNQPRSGVDHDITRPLASAGASKEQVTVGVTTLERGRAVGAEPGHVGAAATAGSSNGLLYDRSHLTGASSTAGTSSSGQQHGPPPSPATSVGTKLSRLVPGNKQPRLRQAAFNAGMPTGYRYYTHRAAPPCTPCSTDINDESDSLAYSAFHHRPHFPSRAGSVAPSRTGYDSETYAGHEELPSLHHRGRYAPPPTTPLYLSDYGDQELSPPASPTTERSFFLNPGMQGPPPSPVPGPINSP